MLQAIGNEELLTEYRNTLKAFYGTLKSCDRYIKFALLTGVTKFSKASVFSDLNNLMDISLSRRFANICGITEHELHRDFKEDIKIMAEKNDMTEEEMKDTNEGNSEDMVRRISFCRQERRYLQSFQYSEHLCRNAVGKLLV